MNEEITLRDIIKAIVILKPGVSLAVIQRMIWAQIAHADVTNIRIEELKEHQAA